MISRFFSKDAEEQSTALRLLHQHKKRNRKAVKLKLRLQVELQHAINKGDIHAIQQRANCLCWVQYELEVYKRLLPYEGIPQVHTFIFSSLLLKESYKLCTETEAEGMHFVAGFEIDENIIASKIVPFKYSHRSMAHARGDHQDTNRKFIDIVESGHSLAALIHSHPGHSNHPSHDDYQTQYKWEIGNNMVSAIWNRNGCIKFFTKNMPFKVKIVGNHIDKVDENVYQLK